MGVRFHYDNPEQGHLLSKFILEAWRTYGFSLLKEKWRSLHQIFLYFIQALGMRIKYSTFLILRLSLHIWGWSAIQVSPIPISF
jgi:hypothetical protein